MAHSSQRSYAIASLDFLTDERWDLPGNEILNSNVTVAGHAGDADGGDAHTNPGGRTTDAAAGLEFALAMPRDLWTSDIRHGTDESDDRGVGAGVVLGFDDADGRAMDGGVGYEIAFAAPAQRPSAPAAAADDAEAIDIGPFEPGLDAKGGGGGGPGGGGSGSESGVLKNYFSGSTLTNKSIDPGPNDPGYDIRIEFKGSGWTVALQQDFFHAADYLTTVITNDIGGGGLYRGKLIDDLYISAELTTIDGVGGVLGQAGPTATWTANDLTAAGLMQFDSADAQTFDSLGLWGDIVIHEMMHVLGFGTLWERHDLVDGVKYIGPEGVAAYAESHVGATFIPVEDGGGSGTAGGHWDEETLGNELMTGYIENDGNPATVDNFLSEFSVMSLADLGYAVTEVSYKDYALFSPVPA